MEEASDFVGELVGIAGAGSGRQGPFQVGVDQFLGVRLGRICGQQVRGDMTGVVRVSVDSEVDEAVELPFRRSRKSQSTSAVNDLQ
ncbi:hypothetical protein [Kitasatospora sp. SolWspMP-SS2h]|uniref:hypothetical protein n=1 Tax=Kitasatospora sp. SolWspMP-SS2h TaxID=1305729 RepID=UPI0011B9497D|nr:hypothetical protein [Kitasatospora sp. SolWspMP-SS2h]